MFTFKDYIEYVKERSDELYNYLITLDQNMVNAVMKYVVLRDFFDLKNLSSDLDLRDEYKVFRLKLDKAQIIKKTTNLDRAEPYSELSSVLLHTVYLKYYNPDEENARQVVRYIAKSYSTLNPHKEYLEQVYCTLCSGEYNRYMVTLDPKGIFFITFPNTVVKVFSAKKKTLIEDLVVNELLVSLGIGLKDNVGIRPIKSFYIEEDKTSKDPYCGFIMYEAGDLYSADPSYSANFMSSNLDEVIANNQASLDYYEENQILQIKVDTSANAVEPIYVGDNENEDLYLNINYPYLIPTNFEKVKEQLL